MKAVRPAYTSNIATVTLKHSDNVATPILVTDREQYGNREIAHVTIQNYNSELDYHYTLDGSEPTKESAVLETDSLMVSGLDTDADYTYKLKIKAYNEQGNCKVAEKELKYQNKFGVSNIKNVSILQNISVDTVISPSIDWYGDPQDYTVEWYVGDVRNSNEYTMVSEATDLHIDREMLSKFIYCKVKYNGEEYESNRSTSVYNSNDYYENNKNTIEVEQPQLLWSGNTITVTNYNDEYEYYFVINRNSSSSYIYDSEIPYRTGQPATQYTDMLLQGSMPNGNLDVSDLGLDDGTYRIVVVAYKSDIKSLVNITNFTIGENNALSINLDGYRNHINRDSSCLKVKNYNPSIHYTASMQNSSTGESEDLVVDGDNIYFSGPDTDEGATCFIFINAEGEWFMTASTMYSVTFTRKGELPPISYELSNESPANREQVKVTINNYYEDAEYYYTMDGSVPSRENGSKIYNKSFYLPVSDTDEETEYNLRLVCYMTLDGEDIGVYNLLATDILYPSSLYTNNIQDIDSNGIQIAKTDVRHVDITVNAEKPGIITGRIFQGLLYPDEIDTRLYNKSISMSLSEGMNTRNFMWYDDTSMYSDVILDSPYYITLYYTIAYNDGTVHSGLKYYNLNTGNIQEPVIRVEKEIVHEGEANYFEIVNQQPGVNYYYTVGRNTSSSISSSLVWSSNTSTATPYTGKTKIDAFSYPGAITVQVIGEKDGNWSTVGAYSYTQYTTPESEPAPTWQDIRGSNQSAIFFKNSLKYIEPYNVDEDTVLVPDYNYNGGGDISDTFHKLGSDWSVDVSSNGKPTVRPLKSSYFGAQVEIVRFISGSRRDAVTTYATGLISPLQPTNNTPTISSSNSIAVNRQDNVRIRILDYDSRCTYHYTLDGSIPTILSPVMGRELTLDAPDTDEEVTYNIRVCSYAEGRIHSDTADLEVKYLDKNSSRNELKNPTLEAEKYICSNREQGNRAYISNLDTNTTYYYTLDGTEPNESSDIIANKTVEINAPDTDDDSEVEVTVKGIKDGEQESSIARCTVSYARKILEPVAPPEHIDPVPEVPHSSPSHSHGGGGSTTVSDKKTEDATKEDPWHLIDVYNKAESETVNTGKISEKVNWSNKEENISGECNITDTGYELTLDSQVERGTTVKISDNNIKESPVLLYSYIPDIGMYAKLSDDTRRDDGSITFQTTSKTKYIITDVALPQEQVVSGWFKLGYKQWIFFDKYSDDRKIGWHTASYGEWEHNGEDTKGQYFHLAGNTIMDYGWYQDTDGSWYYLDDLTRGKDEVYGATLTGWWYLNNNLYYLDPSQYGKMLTGWQQIQGDWYYFNADGSMVSSTEIDGYYLSEHGNLI